jgi:hypothetical protein
MMLQPPVSIRRLRASGLPISVLVGAAALTRMPMKNRARSSARQSSPALSTIASIDAVQAR